MSGVVAIKLGDKVTTDHIMPAGARMKYRSNVPKYAEFVFESVDPGFARRAAEKRDGGLDNVIVAGLSYGQGSSREHAALAPMYLGLRAVIVKSFARIHRSNLINFGILPVVFAREADYDKVSQNDELVIEGALEAIGSEEGLLTVTDKTTGYSFKGVSQLTDHEREVILAGGLLPFTKEST